MNRRYGLSIVGLSIVGLSIVGLSIVVVRAAVDFIRGRDKIQMTCFDLSSKEAAAG